MYHNSLQPENYILVQASEMSDLELSVLGNFTVKE